MEMITEGAQIARYEADRNEASRNEAGRALPRAQAGEYLTCRLGAEEYGIDIQKVQEIRSYEPPTRIPNAQHFVKGVVNLRGVIVPIIDLRLKLACADAEYTSFTVVIVLAVRGRTVGVVVDSVSDVQDLAADSIKGTPGMDHGHGDEFITGIASVGERMLMLVDIEALLGDIGLRSEVQ